MKGMTMKSCKSVLLTMVFSFCASTAQRSGGTIASDFNAFTKVDPPAVFEYRDLPWKYFRHLLTFVFFFLLN
jgi:hypothetical protein